MYSGNQNSNTMLYGGPLGTYLSGIYQPAKPANQNTSRCNRQSSLRNKSGIGSLSNNSASSLYYTPQPRRRQENSELRYNQPNVLGSSSYKEVSPNTNRPKSFYSPSTVSSTVGNYGRPTSIVMKDNVEMKLPAVLINSDSAEKDYKKLYEEEKAKNDKIRMEILEVEKALDKNKNIIERETSNISDNFNLANEMDLKEFELLKIEGDKLKAENRALSRVVARLSREK